MSSNRNIELNINQGAEVCYLHFCSRTKKTGSFERYPVPSHASSIYLNCGQSDWYVNGIPEIGDLQQSIDALKIMCDEAGASRIICIGASMGAFGAALYASRLACELICFGTELYLNVYSGYSVTDLKGYSAISLLSQPHPKRSLIAVGAASLSDLVCAVNFSNQWRHSNLIILNDCGHESARRLKDLGILAELIEDFEAGKSIDLTGSPYFPNEKLSYFPVPSPDQLNAETLGLLSMVIYEHLLINDRLRLAALLVGKKSYKAAISFIQRFRIDCGEIPELLLLEATALFKMHRSSDALQLIKKVERLPAFRHRALSLKAAVLEKVKRVKEALDVQAIITQEHLANSIYMTAVAKVQNAEGLQ